MNKMKNGKLHLSDLLVYLILTLVMLILNFCGKSHEPVSLALAVAMLVNNLNIPLTCIGFALSGLISLNVSALNFLVYVLDAAFLFVIFALNSKLKRKVKADALIYSLISLFPFMLFFKCEQYAFLPKGELIQKLIFSAAILLLCGMFTSGFSCALKRLFRCRLKGEEYIFIGVMAITFGLGLYQMGGKLTYVGAALTLILFTAIALKEPSCLIFALLASLPRVILDWSVTPLAVFILYSAVALFFSKEGRYLTAITVFLTHLSVAYFEGIFYGAAGDIIPYILCGAIPCILSAITPELIYKKLEEGMKAYRERALSRVAINRNRAVIGEQLFEVSSLFRQIEGTFFCIGEGSSFDEAKIRLFNAIKREACSACDKREACKSANMDEHIAKLVNVGCVKGRVSLIDLPKEIATGCSNTNPLLFCINKHLKDYGKYIEENEIASSGRALLSAQAHGISEVIKNIALEQSRPLNIYTEKEHDVADELARNGVIASEILIYGDEDNLTVTLTVFGKYSALEILTPVSKVLGFDFILADKLVVSHDKFSYILRVKTKYDATFGIAYKIKEGESVSGDTHSVIKIDERRFLVALADGSGSGENARNISDSTISLLESFYRAKMPADTILSTVNKLLTFSEDEYFSCLDLACVSLDDGEADVVKLGGAMGFIFSENEIRILESESLPIGAVECIHPTTIKTRLKENDVLVFLSDGITEAFGSSSELFDFIKDFTPLNPQKFADELLAEALNRYGGAAKDDMTVVAVRLFKSSFNN